VSIYRQYALSYQQNRFKYSWTGIWDYWDG